MIFIYNLSFRLNIFKIPGFLLAVTLDGTSFSTATVNFSFVVPKLVAGAELGVETGVVADAFAVAVGSCFKSFFVVVSVFLSSDFTVGVEGFVAAAEFAGLLVFTVFEAAVVAGLATPTLGTGVLGVSGFDTGVPDFVAFAVGLAALALAAVTAVVPAVVGTFVGVVGTLAAVAGTFVAAAGTFAVGVDAGVETLVAGVGSFEPGVAGFETATDGFVTGADTTGGTVGIIFVTIGFVTGVLGVRELGVAAVEGLTVAGEAATVFFTFVVFTVVTAEGLELAVVVFVS